MLMAFKMKGTPMYRNYGVGDSPNKTMGYEVKIEKGKVVSAKEKPHNDFKPGREGEAQHEQYHDIYPEKPFTDAEGRPFKATRKVCLPKAKIASMSSAQRQKVINAKRSAAAKGKTRRSSKSFIRDGSTKSRGLRDWVKQDWRQVGNPSKKCGEK
jgi:hypothetical protein